MTTQRPDVRFAGVPTENRVTLALVGIVVALALANQFLPITSWLAVGTHPAIDWQYWRPLLYGFTSIGLLQAAINALVLYLMGRGFENELGGTTFLGAFVLCGLGAATVHTLVGPQASLNGAICAVFGVVAGYAVLKHRVGQDIRGDIILLALMIVWSVVNGGQTWLGELGGIAVGVTLGAVLAYAPWHQRQRRVRWAAAGVAGLCLVLITLRWAQVI